MEISQPVENIKLSEKDEKSIEEGKNRLTLIDAETKRLAKLKASLESDITKINAYLQEVEGKAEKLSSTLKKLQLDTAEWETKLKNIKDQYSETEKARTLILKDVADEKAEMNEERVKLNEFVENMNKRDNAVAKREVLVKARELELELKESKLREILK